MLGKLLKYDMRSVGRFWWIAMLTMIGASFSAALSLRFYLEMMMSEMYWASSNDFWIALGMTVSYIIFLISVIAIGVCIMFVAVLIYVRYYKHLFTDEGYLTFTLPVSRKQIFFSKLVNAGFWMMLSEAVLLICGLIIFVIAMPSYGKGILAIDTFKTILTGIFDDFCDRGVWIIVQGILSVLSVIASTMLSVGVIYFCITIGATVAKRAKIIVGVGAFYLINTISRIFATVFGAIPIIWIVMALLLFSETNVHLFNGATSVMMLMFLAIQSLLAAFFHCLTLNILERKLNLA